MIEEIKPIFVTVPDTNKDKCFSCSKVFDNSILAKILSTISVNEGITCIVCNNLFCQDCYKNEKRYFSETKKTGYSCKNCYDKTRTDINYLVIDLNPVYNLLEKQIPELVNNVSDNISLKLSEINKTIEEQKNKAKTDLNDLINQISSEHLPKLIEESNNKIGSKLDELINIFNEQKNKTKGDIEEIIDETLKNKITPLIYKLLFVISIIIIIITGLITLEVMFIIKQFN